MGGGRRWKDNLGAVVVSICENGSGKFAKVEILPISQKGRRVMLCLPAWRNGGGWGALSEALFDFVHLAARVGRGSHQVARRLNQKSDPLLRW